MSGQQAVVGSAEKRKVKEYVLSVGEGECADQTLQQFFEENSKDKKDFLRRTVVNGGSKRDQYMHSCGFFDCDAIFKKPSDIAQHVVTASHVSKKLTKCLREHLRKRFNVKVKLNVKYN